MRVVHINEHLSWAGGVETYLLHLLPRLAQSGVEAWLAYGKGDSALFDKTATVPEISVVGKEAERAGYLAVRRLLERLAPDLVHIHRVHNLGVIEACLDAAPTVITSHDYMYLCPAASFFFRRGKSVCSRRAGPGCFVTTLFRHCLTPRPRFALAYYRRVRTIWAWRSRFHAVICPSDSVRDRFLRAGFNAELLRTVPYFCPITPAVRPRPRPGKPTILFVGRMRVIKGYDIFIKALGLLRGDIRGVMVGDVGAETQRSISRLADYFGCTDRIEIRPWAAREQIRRCYEKSTIFVFPSVWPETLGIVGLEAMACGVPVVASDIGGVRQWLEHGRNGYLVPPKDARALADAIETVLSDDKRLGQMEQAALGTIRARFLPEHHLTTLLDIYRAANTAVRNSA